MNTLLAGVVGSTAYGLAHAGSDRDVLGMFAAPTADLHGLCTPRESHVTTQPDSTFHEAGKAVRLILSSNPTASELLWLDVYDVRTPLGDELIALRGSLLSAPGVRNAYLGYATQQFRKLLTRDPDSRTRAANDLGSDRARVSARRLVPSIARRRDALVAELLGRFGNAASGGAGRWAPEPYRSPGRMHARHLVRLLRQAEELHTTGRLTIRLPDPDEVRRLGEWIAEDPERARPLIARAEAVLDTGGVLPEAPDEAAADAWLHRVRRAFYE
ncbi:hypothetical protein ABIA33_001816 [Streptacidiphilus sp. MAP12-16]|uniref:DNA polymerase beta superfamily protein n=1 Tax=Streptacidiphilus sp. MAP12-16 TaxID=3156300 RepID=UPI0035164776